MATFYKPYVSDDSDDSDSESDTDSDGYTSEESLLNVAGRSKPVPTAIPASASQDSNVITTGIGTKFVSEEKTQTTLFTINSRDRDTNVYPQPTYFTIRLPRVYKNVKTINISQLTLLNSFFNFATSSGNTWMYVYEQGRTSTNPVTGVTSSNAVRIQIRDGTYGVGDLVTELSNSLNKTPLFADISLGTFINVFQSTGDFSPLFNTPGPVVFNSLTQTYDTNQTIANIVGRYFQTVQTVGTISYTYNQCLVAYYYPIVKEMIIAQQDPLPFSVVGQSIPPGFVSWYDYIVFAFTGLDDPYITAIVGDPGNQTIFTSYRYQNTFNQFLVNKYNCAYNTQQGRLVITAPSLNPSITFDVTTQYTTILNDLVLSNGFSNIDAFTAAYNSISSSNGALIEYYNFVQSRFASNFGVNFGAYSAAFYANSNFEIDIYNTSNRYGWNLTLTPAVSISTISSNALPEQCPNFWSNLQFDKTRVELSSMLSTLIVPSFTNTLLQFSNAGESHFGYTDISFSILPTNYVRTTFSSRCRQNISLMTLPRYQNERGPGTDEVYDLGSTITQTPLLYDTHSPPNTYILTDISGNITFNLYTISQNMFTSASYMRSLNEWLNYMTPQILAGSRLQPTNPSYGQRPAAGDISLTTYRPYIFFQVNGDKYPAEPNARFRISFFMETPDGTNFPVPIVVTWYKDRAGFMADTQTDLNGNFTQDPRHYFQQTTYGTTLSSAEMIVTINNLQTTYFMVHTQSPNNVPSSIPLRVFAVLTDPYGEYTIATQDDRLDLPYANLPTLSDQFTPASKVFQDPTTSIYDPAIFQLGYDISGISNNLLDYVIQTTSGNYYDPNNITDYLSGTSTGLRYLMNLQTVGATQPPPTISTPQTWSLYFGSNSQNVILDTYNTTNSVYLSSLQTPKPLLSTQTNESIMVNWFRPGDVKYPPTSELIERFIEPNINTSFNTKISSGSVFLPCYNRPTGLLTDSQTLTSVADARGFCGISFFMEPNKIVTLDSLLLKFAYTQPSANSNDIAFGRLNSPLPLSGTVNNGAYYRNQTTLVYTGNSTADEWDDWFLYNRRNTRIGIFNTSAIAGSNANLISISSAICTMTLGKVTQVNNYQNQPGTLRTREPDWGTYYSYKFDQQPKTLWDVQNVDGSGTAWRSTIVPADTAPVYEAGDATYPNYFQTPSDIFNYTYLPRTYGVAPAVGMATYSPTLQSTLNADIPNSYTAVPFYNDPATNTWKVGGFWGLSYTKQPALPSTTLAGAAPYTGPLGGYAWNVNSVSTIQQVPAPFGGPMFYWNAKLRYETLDQGYNPATDLAMFGGYSTITSEYQDTMLFFYKNMQPNQDLGDISTVVGSGSLSQSYWTWGQEQNSNYVAYDDQSGYNYLSYLHDVPVRSSITYATHVRAYDPIPRFNTGLRFIGKNYTDFGRPTLWEIATEISSLSGYTPISDGLAGQFINNLYSNVLPANVPNYGPYTSTISTNNGIRYNTSNFFSHNYADALINFNTLFVTPAPVLFGKTTSFPGVPFSFTGYPDSIAQYVNYYSTITGSLVLYQNILSTATGELNQYVIQRYGSILPSTILSRNQITAPLPFQFLFSTFLTIPYKSMYDQWGLGWNMGFNKADTYPAKTTITSDTFIRIVQDYIYLQLNPEHNINSLGVSSKEDLAICRESAGQGDKYFSKIILNDFASYCRTAVQKPHDFAPVLGKYDTISCRLLNRAGMAISNVDCEYDMVLEITELTNAPKDTSSLLGPTSDLDLYAGKK